MGGSKNIDNVDFEEITNPYFGNQFIGYFLRIPQTGYYAESNSFELKSKYVDKINETVRGVTLPESSTTTIPVQYFGHQNLHYNGIGSGDLGTIITRMKLDRYLNNYTTFLVWSHMVYDWTAGGINNNLGITDQDELSGIITVEFIDSEENRTRKISYKVIVESLPPLSLGVDTPDEVDVDVTFKIVDMDVSQFVISAPLQNPIKI